MSNGCGCSFDVALQVGLITVRFADLTHHGSGDGSACVVVCLEVGSKVVSSTSTCCIGLKLAQEKLTTISERFLMVEWAIASSAWVAYSLSLVSHTPGVSSAVPIVS